MATSVLGSLGGLLVAHFIGPEETGLFRYFSIPLMYLSFLHIGTFDGLWRQIPYYVGKNMPEKVNEISSAAGAWNVLIAIVISGAFFCCAIFNLWQKNSYGFAGWLSQVFCCWAVFYGGYLNSTYRTLDQFVSLSKIQFLQILLNFASVFLVPFIFFYGLCVRAAIPSILNVWLLQRNRPLKIHLKFNSMALKEVVRVGLPFSFWGSLYTSIWAATESALILFFDGMTGLGLFSIAAAMREGVNTLPQAVQQVLTPRLVSAFAREDRIRSANEKAIWLTIALTGFMILTNFFISLFIGMFVSYAIPKYIEGIPLMQVCIWFSVIQAASLPLNSLFAADKPWLYGRGIVAGIIVFPIAVYVLEPFVGGVFAVVIGSLIGRSVRTVAAYIDLYILTKSEN